MTDDPVHASLERVRDLQEKVLKAQNAALDALGRLRGAETDALLTVPATIDGALELLRHIAVELHNRDVDPRMLSEAINVCCRVLESVRSHPMSLHVQGWRNK